MLIFLFDTTAHSRFLNPLSIHKTRFFQFTCNAMKALRAIGAGLAKRTWVMGAPVSICK